MHSPQYFRSPRDGRERWLVSYTDILALLLILFIAMPAQAIGQSQAHATAQKPAPEIDAPPKTASTEPAAQTPVRK